MKAIFDLTFSPARAESFLLGFRFILRQVSGATDAEDLTQDTFLEVYRNIHRFRGASKFSTWVMGIALNISRNYRTRAPERRYHFQSDEVLETVDAGTASPRRQVEVPQDLLLPHVGDRDQRRLLV
ncbi:MAG: hypothetical protein HOA30_07760 [Rhodospirillaceae bacterium]|nr:hypothetical protein [Rhodospirillaceae bacterium]